MLESLAMGTGSAQGLPQPLHLLLADYAHAVKQRGEAGREGGREGERVRRWAREFLRCLQVCRRCCRYAIDAASMPTCAPTCMHTPISESQHTLTHACIRQCAR